MTRNRCFCLLIVLATLISLHPVTAIGEIVDTSQTNSSSAIPNSEAQEIPDESFETVVGSNSDAAETSFSEQASQSETTLTTPSGTSIDESENTSTATSGNRNSEIVINSALTETSSPESLLITLGGLNRAETSAAEARYAFSSSDWAIVVGWSGYADAIGAAGLAGALECPVIVTYQDRLIPSTENLLIQLNVKHVIILGGSSVVSNEVENRIESIVGSDGSVQRLWGASRYETQMEVYNFGIEKGLWTGNTVILATGEGFADALSASPLAYKLKSPVFFVNYYGNLSIEQENALREGHKNDFIITGGTGVVPQAIENHLNTLGNVIRLGGGKPDTKHLLQFVNMPSIPEA